MILLITWDRNCLFTDVLFLPKSNLQHDGNAAVECYSCQTCGNLTQGCFSLCLCFVLSHVSLAQFLGSLNANVSSLIHLALSTHTHTHMLTAFIFPYSSVVLLKLAQIVGTEVAFKKKYMNNMHEKV